MAASTATANGVTDAQQNGQQSSSSAISTSNNPALECSPNNQIRMIHNEVREPRDHEVLLQIKTTGICGSDIHLWKSGGIGPLRVEGDYVLGHEAAGRVLKVGKNVKDFKPGDRVAVEPQEPCDNCYLCGDGRYNLCQSVMFCGVYPGEGCLQRFKCHPAKWLHKIPDNMSYSQGALLEPLSVVMHGIKSCGLALGKGVSIHGAGPIGLVSLVAARASGAHPIAITDIEPGRLKFAKQIVPSCMTYQVQKDLDPKSNANNVRKLFGAGPVNETWTAENEYDAPGTVLECTGVESSVATAAYTCRRGGTVMVIGVGKSMMNNVPFMHLSLSEVLLST